MAEHFVAQWLGLDSLEKALDAMAGKGEEAAKAAVEVAAKIVEAEIKANFEGSHSRGSPHVGGDKPNIVSGTLRRSVHANPVTQFGPKEYGTFVGPRTVYGRRVELGYRGSRAFPYTEPAYKSARPKISAAQNAVFRKLL